MAADESLDILLRQICKAHTNKINRILENVGLHKGQPMMLRRLYRKDGIPQTILAREMIITPATASAMVKRLEKAGFVIRRRDAEDERVSNVYLTEAGREISAHLHSLQNQMDAMVFKGFSTEDKETMRSYLERILDNLAN